MNNEFDKDLKQRLGNASLQEAGLPFDKDKLWGKIEKKKAKKRLAFLPWISHAAAVAAGLAAGIFLFVNKDKPEGDNQQVVSLQRGAPAVQLASDTVYLPDTVYLARKEKEQNQPQPIKLRKTFTPPPGTITAVQTNNITQELKQPETDIEPVVAVNKPMQPKVLHLSDLDNENSKPHIRAQEKQTFLVRISNRNSSGASAESISMFIAQNLNLTKN